ncbi:MAG: sulfurtransferase [Anaerolineae bacterium]|nr:sulfurtransferase [Anaerolineae bacterium]
MTDSPQFVVATDWLAAHLDDPKVRVVDIRGHVLPASEPLPHYFNHQADYDKSHVPGAVFVDWVNEITDPDDPRHAQIAKPERYAAVITRLGIAPDTLVVAYDDANAMFAARMWWSLNYYGHPNVAILDGGWQKWVKENRPATAAVPAITPKPFVAIPNPAWRRTGDQVLAVLGSDTKLLDLRSKEEYDGLSSRAKRKGHIPGAISSPRQNYFDPNDGTLLPPDQLRQKFAELGVDETTGEVVTYCNGGVSASFGLLALRAAGLTKAAMYDGSWKDWGNDDSKPIE